MITASATAPASAAKLPMTPRTRNAHTKTPITIDGNPAMSSAAKRTGVANFPERYSTTKMAAAIPTGMAIAPESAASTSVPTSAGWTPPPTSPTGFGRCVKKSRLSAGSPCTIT